MRKIILLSIIIVFFIVFIVVRDCGKEEEPSVVISDFLACITHGYPALESYPRQCKTSDGKTYTEDIGNELEKLDLIRINTPRPNMLIESPLKIEGGARGYWFFEGDFPVKLLDGNGQELVIGIARALSEWMVEDFVSFEAEIDFARPATPKGDLILQKDNPSGLPENDDFLRVPVRFSE